MDRSEPDQGDTVLYTVSLTNSTAIGSLILGTPGGAQTLNLVSNAVLTVSTLVGLNPIPKREEFQSMPHVFTGQT